MMPKPLSSTGASASSLVSPTDWIEGAAKALAVLESFSAERQRLSVTQVAERAGITRAAARRHLLTLRALGYVESDEEQRSPHFWLTHRVLRLAGSYLASARLPRVVQPTLNHLAQQTGQAFSVAVLDGSEAVIVARSGEHRMASRALPYGVNLGARLAAFATSTGRVLLAQLSGADFKQWLKAQNFSQLTPHTITERKALAQLIAQIGQQGYAQAHEEHELGVHALAVPLHDARGRVVAAMNMVVVNPAELSAKALRSLDRTYLATMQAAATQLRMLL